MFDNVFYLFDKLVIENNYWTDSSYKIILWTLITSFYKELIDSVTLFKIGGGGGGGAGRGGKNAPGPVFPL